MMACRCADFNLDSHAKFSKALVTVMAMPNKCHSWMSCRRLSVSAGCISSHRSPTVSENQCHLIHVLSIIPFQNVDELTLHKKWELYVPSIFNIVVHVAIEAFPYCSLLNNIEILNKILKWKLDNYIKMVILVIPTTISWKKRYCRSCGFLWASVKKGI